ncbi:hypothetical protein LX36DRAFT_237600 [Colletotrichum falcatum]|nr:hypothetical protein LX36DRAFT_237600 [Colletotrichum falcatum]
MRQGKARPAIHTRGRLGQSGFELRSRGQFPTAGRLGSGGSSCPRRYGAQLLQNQRRKKRKRQVSAAISQPIHTTLPTSYYRYFVQIQSRTQVPRWFIFLEQGGCRGLIPGCILAHTHTCLGSLLVRISTVPVVSANSRLSPEYLEMQFCTNHVPRYVSALPTYLPTSLGCSDCMFERRGVHLNRQATTATLPTDTAAATTRSTQSHCLLACCRCSCPVSKAQMPPSGPIKEVAIRLLTPTTS